MHEFRSQIIFKLRDDILWLVFLDIEGLQNALLTYFGPCNLKYCYCVVFVCEVFELGNFQKRLSAVCLNVILKFEIISTFISLFSNMNVTGCLSIKSSRLCQACLPITVVECVCPIYLVS